MSSRSDPLVAHRALVAKVDAFEREVRARRDAAMQCRSGCSACCNVELTVCEVEAARVREGLAALDDDARARLSERAAATPEGRCVMLEADGCCAIYDARPLVCRTQGLPLRYPDGIIPAGAVMGRARGAGGELTWCPLNFEHEAPRAEDVLDAERVDAMLALSNREHVARAGGDPTRRVALRELARHARLNGAKRVC